jgi:hypothetical protein
MQHLSYYVVLGCVAGVLLGSWAYFRRYQVSRPPIGVFNLKDIALMVVLIILLPLLYLALPLWLAASLLLLVALSLLYFTWEPVLRARWAIWLATLSLLALDSAAAFLLGTSQNAFFAVNNTVLLLMVVGATNLWVQSGMKARDAALLGVFLALYDFIATAQLPLMGDLVARLSGLPLAPMVAWSSEHSLWGIGLGDVLLATVFPLVMRKAFGRTAGLVALLLALLAIGTLLALPLQGLFPVMVVLGPLMLLQYLYWRRRRGRERTTWQYLQEEPLEPRGQNPPLLPEPLASARSLVEKAFPFDSQDKPFS